MQKPAVRLILFAVLLAIGIGAGVLAWNGQARIADIGAAEQDTNARLDRMTTTTAALTAAQGAYVAPGQPDDPWLAQVTSLIQTLANETTALKARVRSAASPAILQAVSERTAAFLEIDGRARENLTQGQELFASDVIYSDGRAALDGIAVSLRAVRDAERAAFTTERATLLQRQWSAIGIAALLWVIGLVLLVRRPQPPQVVVAPPAIAKPESMLDLIAMPEEPPAPPARPAVDLAAAADLCTAIARMTRSVELPDLLARAAALLDASGIIIWMGAGEELFAVTAHGYDPRVISRLGPIARNADNATATSWRTGEVKTFASDIMTNGAVVAPLFAPDACIGVLAAEVRHRREDDADTRAVTAMIASQLATALTAWPATSAPPAATAGT
jgi:hypothetical protein